MQSLSRRTFLQSSLAAATVLATKAAANASGSETVDIPFALIGAGGQGRHVAFRLAAEPGTRLEAICDINPASVAQVKQLAPDVRVYEDWNEMLAKEKNLRAAVVGLPEHIHSAASIAALDAGLNVFCEKPMAYSLDQSRAMIAARDRNKRVLQIGQQRRSNPLYYLAERMLQKEGAIGEIIRVDAFWDRWADWTFPLPAVEKDFGPWGYPTLNHLVNWRLYRKYGHGLMTENGTHQMDASGWLLGNKLPQRVCGVGVTRFEDGRETHDVVSADYEFDGKAIVRFCQDLHQGTNYRWSYGELFLGKEGAMRVTAEQELFLIDEDRRETRVPIERLGDIELGGVPAGRQEMTEAEADRASGGLRSFSYQNEMRIFANCVRNGGQPTCTGEIGHNSIVSTIVGTEAQYNNVPKVFSSDMFT
jgi:predicted dehydrogenase